MREIDSTVKVGITQPFWPIQELAESRVLCSAILKLLIIDIESFKRYVQGNFSSLIIHKFSIVQGNFSSLIIHKFSIVELLPEVLQVIRDILKAEILALLALLGLGGFGGALFLGD